MRKAFAGLAALLLLVVVAQFFFAATGAFSTVPHAFRPHHVLGYVIFVVPLVLAGIGALARVPGRLILMAALVAGLTAVQVLIADLAEGIGAGTTAGGLMFGLHAVNGLAILAVTGVVARRARALRGSAAPAREAVAGDRAGVPGPVAEGARPATP
jgi:hypothetical protein